MDNDALTAQKPLLVVMTPVRNEARILKLFLKFTSQWADYIIVADQMSIDGSRDLYKDYSKVIVVDNDTSNFNERERQSMLINKAREIINGRDAILFALDADEVFEANFKLTNDWNKIINSKPGDVFSFRWAELMPDRIHYTESKIFFPWAFHDDGQEPHLNYTRNVHSMRIPYPKDTIEICITDFYVIHFAHLFTKFKESKQRFYIFVMWQGNNDNPISLYRTCKDMRKDAIFMDVKRLSLPGKDIFGCDMWNLMNFDEKYCWTDDFIYKQLERYSLRDLQYLPIWDDVFLKKYNISDPRGTFAKWLHLYLRSTNKYSKTTFIRGVDKIIKIILRYFLQ